MRVHILDTVALTDKTMYILILYYLSMGNMYICYIHNKAYQMLIINNELLYLFYIKYTNEFFKIKYSY